MGRACPHLPAALLTGTHSCSGVDADIHSSWMSPANKANRFTKKTPKPPKKPHTKKVVTILLQGSKLKFPCMRSEKGNGGRGEVFN